MCSCFSGDYSSDDETNITWIHTHSQRNQEFLLQFAVKWNLRKNKIKLFTSDSFRSNTYNVFYNIVINYIEKEIKMESADFDCTNYEKILIIYT